MSNDKTNLPTSSFEGKIRVNGADEPAESVMQVFKEQYRNFSNNYLNSLKLKIKMNS